MPGLLERDKTPPSDHIGSMPQSAASEMLVFDRVRIRRQRDRAADGLGQHDFLLREVASRLAERLSEVRRRFPSALDLGCHTGQTAAAIHGHNGCDWIVGADLSPAMARRSPGLAMAADEELLPFAPASFDLAVSNLSLHWVNDLPGALIQIRRVLKPDGLFLGAMLGGDTLFELRRAFMEAELRIAGGISPRVSPMAELRDAGSLMQRAGFALPVVDSESFTVTYPDAFRLMAELRGMGESNAVLARSKRPLTRSFLAEVASQYQILFAEGDGRLPATFQVIYLIGWAPSESQQRPLRPGSALHRLADALGAAELSAGDRAAPH